MPRRKKKKKREIPPEITPEYYLSGGLKMCRPCNSQPADTCGRCPTCYDVYICETYPEEERELEDEY